MWPRRDDRTRRPGGAPGPADMRQLLASARIGLWTWDLRTNRVFYSEEWKRQLGITGELTDSLDEWASRVHPDDAARLQAQMQAVFESGATEAESHCRLRHVDGSYRDILAQSSIARDEDGRATHVVGSHVDLTDAGVRDRSLFAVSARLVEASSVDIDTIIEDVLRIMGQREGADRCYLFLYDLDRGTFSNTHEWCVPGVQSHIRELQGLELASLPWFREQVGRGVVLNALVEELPPEAGALRAHLEKQSILSLLTYPLQVDKKPFGFVGFDAVREKRRFTRENEDLLRIVGDMIVSALRRIRAERAERIHAARRREALDSLERAEQIARIGSWSFDPTMGRLEWSRELFRIFGFEPTEGVPSLETFRARLAPESRGVWEAAHRRAVEEGRPFDVVFGIRRPDGETRWIRGIGDRKSVV